MDPKLRKLGGSLEVPCVQELAKEQLSAVPPRYVRSDLQDPPTPIVSDTAPFPRNQLPVIDLQSLLCGDDHEVNHPELEKLHFACKDWGFFQLINHGVNHSLVEKVKLEIQEFFKLPLEEKKKFRQEPGDVEGYGQAFVVSEEQKLDWADMFYMVTLPTYLRKPHLFPKLPIRLRETIEEYSAALKNLGMKILGFMAKALKMKDEEMRELFEEGTQGMRINFYPPCPQPELAIGLSPHSDGIGLTILLQLNELDGLQIKKDGMWVPVNPLPGAFIVNIGDMLEIVTNGTYRSVEHGATVNVEKERLSIATFLSPRIDGNLGPAPSLITPQTPPLFRTVAVADFFRGYFSRELRGKSHLDVLRISS